MAFEASNRYVLRLVAGSALALLTACGGGGGGGAPPPPAPVNQAPAFTSPNAATVVENGNLAVYQASATDPEGTAVAFSITGGADSARFNISPNGQLSFVTSPNFDLPTDSDLNNVYLVEIGASDGVNRSVITVAVTVTNSKEGVSVRRIATGFVEAVAISPRDETRLLVAERGGAIYSLDLQSGARQLLAQIPSLNGQGVISIAANEGAGPDQSFVVMYMNNDVLVVQEYLRLFNGSYGPNNFGPVLTIPAPNYAGGGWVGFDFGNQLLIATGAAAGAGDPTGSAQSDSSRLGKIILARKNPDPFAGASPSFYFFSTVAKGLHQPVGGFAFTLGSNDSIGLLIGDRGQTVADEVNFLGYNASGLNYGWPFKEGFQPVQANPPAGLADPVTAYARLSGSAVQGNVGGAIAGNQVASISRHYVFADRSGAIFAFPTMPSLQNARTTTERRTLDFAPDAGAIERPVGVVADTVGRLYILDSDGEIFRVEGS